MPSSSFEISPRSIKILSVLAASSVFVAILLMQTSAHPTAPPALRKPPAVRAANLLAQVAAEPVAPQTFEQVTPQQAQLVNAAVPFSTLPNPAAAPFTLRDASPTDRARALTCLTLAVYYEAASESAQGEAAVAQVVLNRMRNPIFPKSVCGVVLQGSSLPTGCQFTFTCDGSLARRPSEAGWKRASQIAERALNGYVEKDVGEATHYHTTWVVPYWQTSVVKLTQIGAHIFYRWKGGLGLPGAFATRYAGGEIAPPTLKDFDTGFGGGEDVTANVQVQVAAIAPAAAPAPVVKDPAIVRLADASVAPAFTPPPALKAQPSSYFGGGGDGGQRLPW
jgi:spore germination cell wall hydrolase CwlJ-like protein